MKDISELGKDIENFAKRLQQNLVKAQSETADIMKKSVQDKSPGKGGEYYDSIKRSKTENKNGVIKTEIYTDLKSNDGYFVGRMIENGTGIYALEPHIGHTKTFFESQYQYWYVPADEVTRPIGRLIEINGEQFYIAKAQRPKPHWKPAFDENIQEYRDKVKKAIQEAMK